MAVADATDGPVPPHEPVPGHGRFARETRAAHALGEPLRPARAVPHPGRGPRPAALPKTRFRMSGRTHARTLRAALASEPPRDLTGALAAAHRALTSLAGSDEATITELALAAGLGRSTTGKALVTLEDRGPAVRVPGGHDGARRTPDHWRATPAGEDATEDARSRPDSPGTVSAEAAADGPEPVTGDPGDEAAPAEETVPAPAAAPDDVTQAAAVPVAGSAPDVSAPDAAQGDDTDRPRTAHAEDALVSGRTPVPQAGAEHRPVESADMRVLAGGKKRRAPGALRQGVIDHLTAHPVRRSRPRASAA